MSYKTFLLNFILGSVLLSNSSCDQHQVPLQTTTRLDGTISSTSTTKKTTGTTLKYTSKSASLTEDFEQAKTLKSSYAAGGVIFKSGSWILVDALVGGSSMDAKNGAHAVRIRNTGKLTMQFELSGVTAITIQHAAYGTDSVSTWQLWSSVDRGNTYTQVGETIMTRGHDLIQTSFNVNISHAVRFEIRKISGGKNRINIDDFVISGGGTDGKPSVQIAPVNEIDPASQHTSTTNQTTTNLLMGNPSNATNSTGNPDNYLIDHKYYVESYSRKKATPNWVSWHIGSSDLGSTDRLNNFRPDTDLPEGWYEADNTSYKGSGFDKGHNCPSGDRTSSTEANGSTFLMDNMIPQAPNNNQHTWEHLESYCRAEVKKGSEVYVIMGSYGSGGTGRNGYSTSLAQGKINVPAHIWKVVVVIPEGNNDLQRINANTKVIAIDTPNDNSIAPNWMNYICTVRDIEKATGYNLLSALPKSLQDVIELNKFKGGN